jgi:hypothetical protein
VVPDGLDGWSGLEAPSLPLIKDLSEVLAVGRERKIQTAVTVEILDKNVACSAAERQIEN